MFSKASREKTGAGCGCGMLFSVGGEDSGSKPMIREIRSVACWRRTAKARKLRKMASWRSRFGSLCSFMWDESWTGTAEPQQKMELTTEGVDMSESALYSACSILYLLIYVASVVYDGKYCKCCK